MIMVAELDFFFCLMPPTTPPAPPSGLPSAAPSASTGVYIERLCMFTGAISLPSTLPLCAPSSIKDNSDQEC